MKRLLLSAIVALLLLPSVALATVGESYSIETFAPYLERGFNTILGWGGRPVDTEDPRLFKYYPNTKMVHMAVEFVSYGGQVRVEVLNVKSLYAKLSYKERIELGWFLQNASHKEVSLQDVDKAFEQVNKCNSHEFYIHATSGKKYYLTVLSEKHETFIRLASFGSHHAPNLRTCKN